MDEHMIIKDIQAGNGSVYRALVERYQTGLIIHCETLLKDRAHAEDIAQESFIKAYDMIRQYDATKGRFSTWLYRIATNKCIDALRVSRRHVPVTSVEEMADEATAGQNDFVQIEALRTAVEQLDPPSYRDVIEAYFWHGESYQQIADRLGVNTNTVGTWMRRAKQQLKEKMS